MIINQKSHYAFHGKTYWKIQNLLLFYHMSFEGKARLSLIKNGSQIMECHWCMESQGYDHQLRCNIMIINLKVYYAFQVAT
jgi:hypothetical protein